MLKEEIEEIGLRVYPNNPNLFGDWEDIEYNNKTKELFYHSCIDGTLTLYRKVTDIEDLKQALYDGFPDNRRDLNLD
jgi:hypothetical protein|tara:strand:- start:5904 stop:6134 length:231 start_codon:yes stop_codon:yes gene_type:complete